MSKINTLKQDAEYDIIGMGEVMIRLSPPGKQKLSQADYFERNIGGSELNVVSGAAMLTEKKLKWSLPSVIRL